MFSCISIATTEGHRHLNPEEIIRLEASSNYTRIYFTNKSRLVASKVLKDFALLLEPFGFVRTHRTHLVNRKHVAFVSREGTIIMKDASVAGISRRMKSGVMKALETAA